MATRILMAPSAIRSAINTALSLGPRKIAVAFWGQGALEALKLDRRKLVDTQIICNLSVGGCSPKVIRDLLDRGADVRAMPTLHAKAYIGAKAAVVGSANASSGGLCGDAGKGWREVCVEHHDKQEIAALNAWFDSLWEESTDMSDPQVANLLLELAEQDQASRGRVEALDLLTTLMAAPNALDDRELYVSLDWQPYSRRVEKQVKQMRKRVNPHVDAWEDWTRMPGSSEILSFYHEPKKPLSFEGIYRTPSDPKAAMDPKTKAIFVVETTSILGKYTLGDEGTWCAAAAKFRDDLFVGRKKPKDENAILHVSEFAGSYLVASTERR